MHNLMAALEGKNAGFLAFKILLTDGTPTISEVSNLDFVNDFSAVTDTGDGDWTFTISNFRGPRGLIFGQATSEVISVFPSITTLSYSGTTLTVVIKSENDASTATDANTQVWLLAV